MNPPPRVVFDCNIFLQAMLSMRGPAFACFQRFERGEVLLFVSPYVLAEIKALPDHPDLRRFKTLTHDRVNRLITDVIARATTITNPPVVFTFERDPDDAHYVNLALEARAKLIVWRDKDLLDLMDTGLSDGRNFRTRFPDLRILLPQELLRELEADRTSDQA